MVQARQSWLRSRPKNVFHQVDDQCTFAQANGVALYRFDVGLPSGPAFLYARKAAARAVMSIKEAMHTYQKNGSPGVPDFARDFVLCHVPSLAKHLDKVAFVPVPGLKSMFELIPRACGIPAERSRGVLYTMTDPGYPPPEDMCADLGIKKHRRLVTNMRNDFLFEPERTGARKGDVIMINYPHNPSGQVMNRAWLRQLCAHCEKYGIRLFNDAAYVFLDHTGKRVTLAEIAVEFPNLSWAEGFSASKIGNFTGWRIGAIVGSS
ncbi:MAG: pyridoxal phosphate-dependent aminotransferase, partial [Candidatus Pacebacteria bacterium]|nr:pyridoxal phosphate-dependent aminotransferase [Candidatus Paceibacterota bacterium]